ncbi:AGAP000806-PA-like protein [Anopheles sinensis]|uniref:AGAP000806-PA-like protein n=1 Tax=Anopheles sinensis TaxID=74873 RepID=A0A084WPJ5_ANOSI|nr:AGAP000806-PA-like protein [Anopheles sinensis]
MGDVCILFIVLALLRCSQATATKTPIDSPDSIVDRLAAIENRISLRDEELGKMLQLLITNQEEMLRLLRQQEPCCRSFAATDGNQQLSGWLRLTSYAPTPRDPSSEGNIKAGVGTVADAPAAYRSSPPVHVYPRSCREISEGMSGEETIYPRASPAGPGEPLEVYCDQDFEGGGWIVIQNRYDGFVNFNRSWEKYREGFGDIGTEFWLGLEEIHRLTVAVPMEIAFVAESFRGERRWARYSVFEIADETDRYRLQKLGVYSGTLGDDFTYNEGMQFTTYDQDNDQFTEVNCALRTMSGWWHRSCTRINFNGLYGNALGIRYAFWHDWLHLHGLKRTRIMIRETKRRHK